MVFEGVRVDGRDRDSDEDLRRRLQEHLSLEGLVAQRLSYDCSPSKGSAKTLSKMFFPAEN